MIRILVFLSILIASNIFCYSATQGGTANSLSPETVTSDSVSSAATQMDDASYATMQSMYGKIVLMITSYNPDTRSTADNLAAFTRQYKARNGKLLVSVENMGCGEFSEIRQWKGRMERILKKYDNEYMRPAIIIVTGREAVSAFLSQDSKFAHETPVLVGSCSSNVVLLPSDTTNVKTWMPKSMLLRRDFNDYNIIGGVVSNFDLSKNIELIKSMYPDTKKLAFLTDNTLGGVTMQAMARAEYNKQMGVEMEYLDGRRLSFANLRDKIRTIPSDTKVLLGTWRVDSTENYVLVNTQTEMQKANPKLPVFSLSSVGMNNWALGGYIPDFQIVGDRLADMCIEFIEGNGNPGIIFLDSHYIFDYAIMQNLKVDIKMLPKGSRLVNEPKTFFETHKQLVVGVAFFFLLLMSCLVVSLYYIYRLRAMQRALKANSEELAAARDKAEEANRMKSAFLANISHEIRTPLNSIVGFSNLITSKEVELDESDLERFGDIIRENSDTLLQLINDVLDISKIETENFNLAMKKSDIVKMSASAVESMAVTCKKPLEFKFNCAIDSLVVNTDETRLRQVLNNLFTNAVKFCDEGSITLDLVIEDNNKLAKFTVTDTGCGIPVDKAQKVFERFVKLNDFKQGTGLGLPICKTIVNKLGGDIWVDTTYKGGARFVFTHSLVL